MKKKENSVQNHELEKLLEHLTLQNDAFSSSNKLLMNYYKNLKSETTNIVGLFKAIICITSSNQLFLQDENLEVVNSCKLSWFESLYNFLNITEQDQETIMISPISDNPNIMESRFELKMTLIDFKTNLKKEEMTKVFYGDIINSLNLIHDSKLICKLISEILSLLENDLDCTRENLFNIYYVKLHNDFCNYEEAILLTNNLNKNPLFLSDNLNFINSSKYFCFDQFILFNRYNLRFLVYTKLENLCWSDRINDMNSQFLQDYNFLFKSDNPKRKLIFNIISSFNQFVSNFMIKTIEKLNVDHSINPSSNFITQNSRLNQENKNTITLSPLEIFQNIEDILSKEIVSINSSIIKPENNASSSIINSINSFTSCISQGIHLDKIDTSSNQFNNNNDNCSISSKSSSSDLTTLSEFIKESKNPHLKEDSVNIEFFYKNDLYSCEWTLI